MPHNPTSIYGNLSRIHALFHPTNSLPHSLNNNNNNNNQYGNTRFNYSLQKISTVTIELNMEQTSTTRPSVVECPLFYPDMIQAFEAVKSLTDDSERKNRIQKLEADYRNRNWVTARLMEELQLLFPTAEDIDSINNNKREILSSSKTTWKHSVHQGDFFPVQTNFSNPSRFCAPSGLLT